MKLIVEYSKWHGKGLKKARLWRQVLCCYRGGRRVPAAPLQVRGGLGHTRTPSRRVASRCGQTDPADDSSSRFIGPPVVNQCCRCLRLSVRRQRQCSVYTLAALVDSRTHQSRDSLRRQRPVRQTAVFLLRSYETLNPPKLHAEQRQHWLISRLQLQDFKFTSWTFFSLYPILRSSVDQL